MIGYCRVAPGDIAQGAGSLYLFALAQPVEEALVDLEPHELKVFRTHGLNPAAVRYLRARLACQPPFDVAELRQYRDEIADHRAEIQEAEEQVRAISGRLEDVGIYCGDWDDQKLIVRSAPGIFQWDLFADGWGCGADRDDCSEKTGPYYLPENYRERPYRLKAFKVWNAFLVAFRSPPVRLFRLRGQSYQAVYRDAIGEFIYIPDERLRKQPSPGTMPWGEYSWEYK